MSTCQKPSFGLNKFISLYLADVKKYKQCLSAEEERQLFVEIQTGNRESFAKLFLSWQYIVFEEVLYFLPSVIEVTELIQESNYACLLAMQKYTLDKGNFKNYLHHNIYRHLDTYVKSNISIIRYPLNVVSDFEVIQEFINDDIVISDIDMNISLLMSKLAEFVAHSEYSFFFFDESYSYQFDNFNNRLDLNIENEIVSYVESPDFGLIWDSWHNDLQLSLSSLKKFQAEIVILYYGLYEENPLSLEEIGVQYGITRERVRQIKEEAVRRLRHHTRSFRLRSYLSFFSNLLSQTFKNPSYFFNVLYEEESYVIDNLKSFISPYKRISRYPHLMSQSAECRRLILKYLEENDEPLSEYEIKKIILNIYPAINPYVISYALKTTKNVACNSMGLYYLISASNLGYSNLEFARSLLYKSTKPILPDVQIPSSFKKERNLNISQNKIKPILLNKPTASPFNQKEQLHTSTLAKPETKLLIKPTEPLLNNEEQIRTNKEKNTGIKSRKSIPYIGDSIIVKIPQKH